MNIWDLKRVNEIFRTENQKSNRQKRQGWSGFSFFMPEIEDEVHKFSKPSIRNNNSKSHNNNEETPDFKDSNKISNNSLTKNSTFTRQSQCQQSDEKLPSKHSRKQWQTKNLKFISAAIYRLLKQYTYASYLDLSQRLYSNYFHGKEKPSAKNIRRRIYDAVNVMLSADVIKKDKNIIQFNTQSFGREDDPASEEIHLSQKTQEKIQSIERKKNYLQHLKTMQLILQKFYKNKMEDENHEGENNLLLPLVAFRRDGNSFQQLNSSLLVVKRNDVVQIQTETGLIARLNNWKKKEPTCKMEVD